jgi:hypothetical protein
MLLYKILCAISARLSYVTSIIVHFMVMCIRYAQLEVNGVSIYHAYEAFSHNQMVCNEHFSAVSPWIH